MTNLRTLLGLSAVVVSASLVGCASRSPATASPPGAVAASDADSMDAGGDAGAVTGGVKPDDGPSPDPVTSQPAPEEEGADDATSTTDRRLSTVAEALDAFEEEEIRLTELLSGKATALHANACGDVCDALASMRRASDAICDLAGRDDPRCTQARDKLAGNESRVEARGCRCAQ